MKKCPKCKNIMVSPSEWSLVCQNCCHCIINKKKLNIWRNKDSGIRLTNKELGNLYDYFYMTENSCDLEKTLKLNNMTKWYKDLFIKVEKIVVPELYDKRKRK